jgi:glycosyltransferase involved in cell wall biosynthesis
MNHGPEQFPALISVVIPVRNEERALPTQLEALTRQGYPGPWEVIVSNNDSADRTAEVARQWANRLPNLRVVDASGRKGINHARNVGAAEARGDFIVFCDGDDVASPRWLEAVAELARCTDVVGGPVDPHVLNDASTVATRFSVPSDGLPMSLGFMPYAFGGNLGVRTQVFRDIGGLNEDYVRGCDEIEFCWRAQLAGYSLGFAPGAVMRYRHEPKLTALARQAYAAGFGETKLYRDFRDKGLRRPSVRRRMREWGELLRRTGDLFRSSESRGTWVRWAAYWFGRIRGSIHHRVLFL